MTYQEEIKKIYCESDTTIDGSENKLREIVRCGTLAASSHNTQCWKFRLDQMPPSDAVITVFPDFGRRCPVVDPDDHHLYCTLGCAIENIVIAANVLGYDTEVDSSEPSDGIRIKLKPDKGLCPQEVTSLFKAIPERQCTRTEYDGKPVSEEELKLLQKAGTGKGVEVLMLTDHDSVNKVLHHVLNANAAQVNNPKFANELKSWIRFSERDTISSGDGLNGKQMGSPFAPRWVSELIFNLVFREDLENNKIRRQVRSSAGFAVFVSERDDPVHWVEAGRCYERFALQATALGIRNAMLNQPVEEADARPVFAKDMGLKGGSRPDLIVRFGRADLVHRSLRRPVEDVLCIAD